MFRFFLLALMLFTFFPRNAHAIPSPDLVINIFASLGQILGLLSVTFGGMALSMRKGRGKGKGGGSPWPFRIALILLAATGVSFALHYSYTLDLRNKRLNANLTRSSSEEGKKVGDVSLKTISFSDQVSHPNGIQTDELAQWLAEGKALNLVDVREPEETEAGMIAHAFHRRYPDIQRDPAGVFADKRTTVLLCFSGNRSSELSDSLTEGGRVAHFMVGGYEKWLAEGRPVGEGVSLKELRKLPYFVNNDVLLDTPEVEELIHEENAVFVDVRYPGDFANNHLPGAVNIPLRKMPTDEMNATLRQLDPDMPIIAPCYDKRSCFYASILGLRLSRFDYDFMGRYTVPHGYVAPARVREHVKRWKEEQQGATFFGLIGKPIQWLLYWIQKKTDAFLFAILFTVFALRFILLPFSVKTEVDRLKEAKRAPQIA
ncbi:MAG: rhodanese-like domain-containing protein, partial [Desulfobacterales bacterium]|nr:rhodanese-like domain-containing protein [Desulfobacterales bacterium]